MRVRVWWMKNNKILKRRRERDGMCVWHHGVCNDFYIGRCVSRRTRKQVITSRLEDMERKQPERNERKETDGQKSHVR